MVNPKVVISFLIIFLIVRNLQAQINSSKESGFPKTMAIDGKDLQKNYDLILANDADKVRALKSLIKKADKLIEEANEYSVMNKKQLPPSGDKHDYMSTGPYWWPDPSKPDGLPYIKKDGQRNPTYYDISDSQEIDKIEDASLSLALAYYFTKELKYANFASKLIKTWFLNPETRQNPHLNFGQGIPGLNTGRGTGIIETRDLFRVGDAAILIQNTPNWNTKDHEELKKWFSEYLTWMLESPIGKDEADSKNNHGTFYSEQVIAFALFSNRLDVANSEIEVFKNRMESQLKSDGSQPFELARTKSWNYVNMNLYGYFLIAKLAENNNVSLWNQQISEGKNIKNALEWIVPYLKNEKIWEYEQIQKISFGETIKILKLAAKKYSNPEYETLAKKIDLKTYQSDIIELTY
ncbi:MAG: alginate lyase family protein [Flavobacterium sp.]|uniref:alginate lyase family protein n=1 Tax=Flavobacterium sp. TaxID=239 RepID=UPI003BD960E6